MYPKGAENSTHQLLYAAHFHFQFKYLSYFKAAGEDLEAVSKFLDTAGQKLDYRRYGVSLIEILVAGGLLGMYNLNLLLLKLL